MENRVAQYFGLLQNFQKGVIEPDRLISIIGLLLQIRWYPRRPETVKMGYGTNLFVIKYNSKCTRIIHVGKVPQ